MVALFVLTSFYRSKYPKHGCGVRSKTCWKYKQGHRSKKSKQMQRKKALEYCVGEIFYPTSIYSKMMMCLCQRSLSMQIPF